MTPRPDPLALLMADLPARLKCEGGVILDKRVNEMVLAIANALETDFSALARSWREREQNTKEGK